ncbi:hypothetical protein CLOP_g24547 [Closterium sp. NIES-67]|nr:hypothetical protein CLOP_g24547 [Closterium sp. NIES-67]
MAQWGAQRQRSSPAGGGIQHARGAKILTLIDDYEDRKAGTVGLTRDHRVSLEFKPFASQSYLHLRNRRLAVLARAPIPGGGLSSRRYSSEEEWEEYDPEIEDPYNEEGGSEDGGGGFAERGGAIRPREPELFDVVRYPLSEALDTVREKLERRALMVRGGPRGGGGGRAHEGVERVKLLVRLGKMLFSAQGRAEAALTNIQPFSAKNLEDHMNEREPFDLPIQRTYETHLPENIYQQVEDMLLDDDQVAHSIGERYVIQVVDSREHVVYKAVCKYEADGRQLFVKKVKKPPVRYGVIDIARPDKVLDARLILTSESQLTTLDDELQAAITRILAVTHVDPRSPAGLRIPAHMTERRRGSDVTTRGYAGTAARGSAGSPSRFLVRAVRHATTRRAVGRGRLWKLARVDGVEFKQGGGRRTNEIEFCPLAWHRELKASSGGGGGSREQQPPLGARDEIMGECPGLLAWAL